PVAREIFDRVLGDRPHQKHVLREDVPVIEDQLLDFHIEGGQITEAGARTNIAVALLYIDSWLQGTGAAALFNLMEDAATAEISRSQLWQWIHGGVTLADGRPFIADLYRQLREEELQKIGGPGQGRLREAADLLDRLVLSPEFIPFLTTEAYGSLD
ncbi:MAG: malate synthase A, partial [Thermoanaerobaculia bacterium]